MKYSKTKCKKFREYIALGMTKENSAVLAFQIDRATYYRWNSDESPLSEKQKYDLQQAVEVGRSELNNRLSLYILKGSADDGALALNYLKRLESATYGDTQKVVGDKDNPLTVNHTFTDDQLKRIITNGGEGTDREDNPKS